MSSHYFPEVTACSFRIASIVKHLTTIESVNVKLVNATYDKNVVAEKNQKFEHYIIYNNTGKRKNFILRFFYEFNVAIKCAKMCRLLKPDLIFLTTPFMAFVFVFMYFCHSARGPWVHLDVRDLVWKYYSPTNGHLKAVIFKLLGVLIERSIKHYDSVSVTNELQRDYLLKALNKESIVLSNGINREQAAKMHAVQTLKCMPDIIKICYVGNIGHAQEMSPLIELSYLRNVQIDLYGTGAQLLKLQQEFEEKNITNIRIHGKVQNHRVHEIYAASDFVFIGIKDYIHTAIPSKVYECAMSGKPVLFSGGTSLKKYLSKFENFFDVSEMLADNVLQSEENLRRCLETMKELDLEKIRRNVINNYLREDNTELAIRKILSEVHRNA